jgi:hypothetical protein
MPYSAAYLTYILLSLTLSMRDFEGILVRFSSNLESMISLHPHTHTCRIEEEALARSLRVYSTLTLDVVVAQPFFPLHLISSSINVLKAAYNHER